MPNTEVALQHVQGTNAASPLLTGTSTKISLSTEPKISPSGDVPPQVRTSQQSLSSGSGPIMIRRETASRKITPQYHEPATSRGELHAQLQAEKPARDKAAIAEILNTYRPNKHADLNNRSSSVKSVHIPLPVLKTWAGELGRMTPEQVEAMFSMVHKAGRLVPLGSFMANILGYSVMPFAMQGVKSVWIPPILTGVIAVVQPLLTSVIQPYVVHGMESFRAKYATMAKRPEGTGSRLTTEIIPCATRAAADLEASAQNIGTQLRAWMEVHGLDATPSDTIDGFREQLMALRERMTPTQQAEWVEMAKVHMELVERADSEDDGLDAAYLYEDREQTANKTQAYARSLRTAGGFFGPVVQEPGQTPSPMDAWLAPDKRWTTPQATGLAVGIALAATFAQLLAAGVDEENALVAELKLQVLSGQVLTEAGLEKWNRGEPIDETHIDDTKCDKLYEDPADSMLSGVLRIITQRRDGLQREVDIRGDLPGSAAHQRIAQYNTDIVCLEGKELLSPRLSRETIRLLDDVLTRPFSYLLQGGTAKLRTNDFPRQLAQRTSVAGLGVIFGSAASMALGGFLLAAIGGRAVAPLHSRWVIQWVVLFIGVVCATLQFTVTLTKTRARADRSISFTWQTLQGIIAPVTYFQGRIGEASTKRAMAKAFDTHDSNAREAIRLLAEGLPESAETVKRVSDMMVALQSHPALQRILSDSSEGSSADIESLNKLVEDIGREGAVGLLALGDLHRQIDPEGAADAANPLQQMIAALTEKLKEVEDGASRIAQASQPLRDGRSSTSLSEA